MTTAPSVVLAIIFGTLVWIGVTGTLFWRLLKTEEACRNLQKNINKATLRNWEIRERDVILNLLETTTEQKQHLEAELQKTKQLLEQTEIVSNLPPSKTPSLIATLYEESLRLGEQQEKKAKLDTKSDTGFAAKPNDKPDT